MPTQHPFINKRNIYSVKCTCMNRDYILSSNNTCMYIFSSCKNLTNLLKWYKNTNNKNKLIKLNKITTKSIHVQLQHVILNGRNMKKALDKFTVLQFCQSYVPWHSSSLKYVHVNENKYGRNHFYKCYPDIHGRNHFDERYPDILNTGTVSMR